MRATVIGLGHVGLVTALGLANSGNEIIGYDTDTCLMEHIRRGMVDYYEIGISEILHRLLNKGFRVANSLREAVQCSNCILFCVGTPSDEQGGADLSILKNAVSDVLSFIYAPGTYTFILRSTIYPGGIRKEILPIIENNQSAGITVQVVANPEFLREGHAWNDFCTSTRLLVGTDTVEAAMIAEQLFANLPSKMLFVSIETAEYTKYLSNCFLATMISFSNEMSNAAKHLGNVSIRDAFSFVQCDERWASGEMSGYVYPGCGYGGYCLPKDTNALLHRMSELNCPMPILEAVVKTNDTVVEKLVEWVVGCSSHSDSIGILGLSFKPETTDVRESPSRKVIEELSKKGYKRLFVFDFLANDEFKKTYSSEVTYCSSLSDIEKNSDIIINMHSDPRFAEFCTQIDKPIFDFRYCIDEGQSR